MKMNRVATARNCVVGPGISRGPNSAKRSAPNPMRRCLDELRLTRLGIGPIDAPATTRADDLCSEVWLGLGNVAHKSGQTVDEFTVPSSLCGLGLGLSNTTVKRDKSC